MLRDYRYSNSTVTSLVCHVHEYFPWLTVDAVRDIGSHAKGEANLLSDYDLNILAHSETRLIRDRSDTNADICEVDENGIDQRVAELYGIPVFQPEYNETEMLRESWKRELGADVNIVFSDSRTLILNLALETPLSAVRTHWLLLTSDTIYDREKMFSSIQRHVVGNRCFHWSPTVDLQIARYRRRTNLKLHLHPSQRDVEFARQEKKLRWLVWALNYVRFAIGAWTLARDGYYTYERNNVLRFISTNLPEQFLDLIYDLYELKCNPDARLKAIEQFLDAPQEMVGQFDAQIRELDHFFELAAMRTEQLRPKTETDRRERNARSLLNIASNWLQIPEFSLLDWIMWCKEEEQVVKQLMQTSR